MKGVLDLFNEFTFYDHYIFERFIHLNHVRVCLIIFLSESDFKHEDNCFKMMGFLGDISQKVMVGVVKNIEHEISNRRVSNLQMLRLEKFHAHEAMYVGRKVDTLDGQNSKVLIW